MPGKKWMLVGLIVAAGAGGAAHAQNNPRFQMERAEGGFMIMDTLTGNTSFCRESGDGFVCSPAPGQRAEDRTIEELRRKITELEARVAALESERSGAADLPSDEEFDRTLNFMERFFRRFVDIVKGLETEDEKPAEKPAAPSGSRT